MLVEPHAGRPSEDGDALLALLTKGSLNAVLFRTTDLDATFEKVRASGAEVLQEPMDQPWGARDCAFRDPSGNPNPNLPASPPLRRPPRVLPKSCDVRAGLRRVLLVAAAGQLGP